MLFFNRGAGVEAALMIAHIPFAHRNAGTIGKRLGRCIIAAIIGNDRASLFLQFKANGLADPAGTPGDNRYPHLSLLTLRLV